MTCQDYLRTPRQIIRFTSIQSLQSKYAFLIYARHHWLVHSARFTPNTPRVWELWKQLIESNNPLAEKPWTASEWINYSKKISQWIVENNHYPLLTIWVTSDKPVANLIGAVAPDSQLGKILCQQREDSVHTYDQNYGRSRIGIRRRPRRS